MRNFLYYEMIIFLIFCAFCLLIYIPRIIGWFGTITKQKRLKNEKMNRFAIVVPARNESKVIHELFESLKKQTYKNFDVHIIVQDPNDKTIKMAKEIDGHVYVLPNQKCKGDALDYCMKSLIRNKEQYDACFIIDADCYMAPNCLEELNNAMASGKEVIQVKRKVKNFYMKEKHANTLASSCNGLIWTIIDDMGNRYKSDHNITGMLIGTGIMVRMDVVVKLDGWPYRQTLTEDIEFMNDCAIRGISTFYYSYAEIYLEESTSLKVTNKRRTRWLNGVINSKRIYNERLKDVRLKDRYFVTALSPVFYYIGACTFFSFANLIGGGVLFVARNSLWRIAINFSIFGFLLIYLSFFIFTFFILIIGRIKRPFKEQVVLLFLHPLFYMWYIIIVAKVYLGIGSSKWEIIDRVDFAEASSK